MLTIGSIVWGVKDIEKEILFWCEALNYRLDFRDGEFCYAVPYRWRRNKSSLEEHKLP